MLLSNLSLVLRALFKLWPQGAQERFLIEEDTLSAFLYMFDTSTGKTPVSNFFLVAF